MMRRFSIIAACALVLASCATPQAQMKKEVKDLLIKSEPEVLVVTNNKIEPPQIRGIRAVIDTLDFKKLSFYFS